MKQAKAGLGRGLGALLGGAPEPAAETAGEGARGGAMMVDITKVEPSARQPRQHFDEDSLCELADSMREFGIVQPLLVKDEGGHYSIIAGERRYRAARLAKLAQVPVLVKDYTEMQTLQVALIENIQRRDLTPIEEAACYKRLMDDFFFSADEVARSLGKSKHSVIGALHLLELCDGARQLAAAGKLTASHAKALLSVEDEAAQEEAARRVAEGGLSVRETEAMIAAMQKEAAKEAPAPPDINMAAAFRQAEDELGGVLGSKVAILPGKKRGRIEIEYYGNEDLERLLELFRRLS